MSEKLFYAVEISTDKGNASHDVLTNLNSSPLTDTTLGLVAGVFRFVSGRPGYDGSNGKYSYGAGEIDNKGTARTDLTNIFYEGFFQKQGIISNPVNEIDITKGGDVGTMSGFEFVLTNSNKFFNLLLTAGPGGVPIQLTGRKVRFIVFINDVFYSRGVFAITNNPADELDFHWVCGPDISPHKMIPPNIITEITFPNLGIGNQQTSQVTIGGAIAPESNIPANATMKSVPLPCVFGDVPYAELCNIEGVPIFENIAILGRGITVPPQMSRLFDISCSVVSDDPIDTAKGSIFTGVFNPNMSFVTDKNGTAFTLYDYGYALVLVKEDLQNVNDYYAGAGSHPGPMEPSPLTNGCTLDAGSIDKYKDYFVFKRGEQKGIRVLRSCTSYSRFVVSTNPNKYRYVFVTVLILAEAPEDFTVSNMLLAPGLGWTPTDITSLNAQALEANTSKILASDTTFFLVCKNLIKQVVSNYPIYKFIPALLNGKAPSYTENADGLPILRAYSSDRKVYENVNYLVQDAETIKSADVNYPYLQLKARSSVQKNGISLLSPVIIPASAVKKIEVTYLGFGADNEGNDPFLDLDSYGLRIARPLLYGTAPQGKVALPFVADSTKTIGQTVYNASDFYNLVDRDRTTEFPTIILQSVCHATGGADDNGRLAINIDSVLSSNGEIATVSIDNGYNKPNYCQPYDIFLIFKGSGTGGMIQIDSVDDNGTPTAISVFRPGNGYTTGSGAADIKYSWSPPGKLYPDAPTQGTGWLRGYVVTFSIDVTSLIDTDVDKAYLGIDFVAKSTSSPQRALSFAFGFRLKDQYGRDIDLGNIVANAALNCGAQALLDPLGNWIVRSVTDQNASLPNNYPIYNLMPKDYYAGGGNDNAETDRFFISSYVPDIGSGNACTEIDIKAILDLVKNRIAQPILLVDFVIYGNTDTAIGQGAEFTLKSVGSGGEIGGAVSALDIHDGGSGYINGNVLLIAGGIGGTFVVTSVTNGRITAGSHGGSGGSIAGSGYTIGIKSSTVIPSNSLSPLHTDVELKIKQIGFVSQKVINTENKQIFTEVKGEMVGCTSASFFNPTGDSIILSNGMTIDPADDLDNPMYPNSPVIGDTIYSVASENTWLKGYWQYTGSIWSQSIVQTNTVYTAIRHLLEDYDKIPSALLDYGSGATDLEHTRGILATNPWYVGRQIKDRQSVFDYLTELCQQSFIGYYISRIGKHTFSAWRENVTPIATHTQNDPILRDSIHDFGKTDISEIFNDFNLQYNNNPGLGKLDKSIIITHIDDAEPGVTVTIAPTHSPGDGFPVIGCIDIDGVPLWEKYVSFPNIPKLPIVKNTVPTDPNIGDSYFAGATIGDWTINHFYVWNGTIWVDGGTIASPVSGGYPACYNSAKTLWDIAHNSWVKTFTQETGKFSSNLTWFNDRSLLSDLTAAAQGIGDKATAFLYLKEAITWLPVQKSMVGYSIPINATNIVLDLLKPISFSDTYYTSNSAKLGWITKIETDVLNGKLNLSLIFQDGTT